MSEFEVKDSGERREYASGMVRDTDEKVRWDLVFDGPMLRRYAEHLTKGALKYAPRNWMKARTEEELDRARQSAARHFAQWMAGETDEDHAAAVIFNLNLAEYVRARLSITQTDSACTDTDIPGYDADLHASWNLASDADGYMFIPTGSPQSEPVVRLSHPEEEGK